MIYSVMLLHTIFDGMSWIYSSSDVFWNNIISYLNVLPTSATLGENLRMQRINVMDNDICDSYNVVWNLLSLHLTGLLQELVLRIARHKKA